MERSQSCCNFEAKHSTYNNNTNSNTNPIPSQGNPGNGTPTSPTSASGRREHRRTKTKSSSAHNLRQLIDGRPHSHSSNSSLMQQVHELKQQQQQQQAELLLPRGHHHQHHLLPYSLKKSPLQRQKSTRSYPPDELDYSADLEDDEDYDEYDDDDDDDDGDVIMPDEAAPHAVKQLILPAAGELTTSHHQMRPQQVHRATLIIDSKLKHCSLKEIAVPRARTPTTTASTPLTTPITSPSPLHSARTFRLPGGHHNPHKQLSLDLPCSPSPSLSMFVQHQCRHHSAGTPDSGTCGSPLSLRRHNFSQLKRGNSLQSDSSHYSSVDSLLESRKPDPEAILINLGFGPAGTEDILSRIPKRFLKPSQVRGIDTEAFVKRLQLANSLADHSALGYRGLTGNPDLPPSSIVAKIMQRFEVNERKKSMGSIETHMR